jgi:hypothetical protein
VIAKYSKKFAYAPYLNEDIGWDKSIPDNATEEEMIQAIIDLNRIATEAHRRMNPQLSVGVNGVASFDVPYGPQPSCEEKILNGVKKKEDIKIGLTPEAILSSPDLTTLITYRLLIKGKPDLQKAYDKRMKELDKSPKKKTGKPVLP